MLRHVLVPLDGSPLAESALPAALALGERFGALVTLLHVLEPTPPSKVHGAPHLREPASARAYLAEIQAWLTARGVRAETHVHVEGTEVVEGIAEHVPELGADLVILCSHGGRGLRGLLFGRVAQQVLVQGTTPVLVVPTRPHPRSRSFPLARMLVPLDGSDTAEAALPPAIDLLETGGTVSLVRVVPTVSTVSGAPGAATRLLPLAGSALLGAEAAEANRYLDRIDRRIRGPGITVTTLVARGDPAHELLAAAGEHSVDLIAIATHGRAGMSARWAGSVTARLAEQPDIAILLIRAAPETGD